MTVEYEVREKIGYISFNRPEKHNALRDEDLASLVVALQRFDTDDSADVGILFGNGRSFSSGGDVNERLQRSVDEGSTTNRATEHEAFTQCSNWKPVIAAVHGYCFGHALSTALLCDHLVAARDARFQVTEIRLGLPTAALVPRLGRPTFANEVAMTGRTFTAEEAWEGGMVTHLVPENEHLEQATELAHQILANPQWAVRENVRIGRTQMAQTVARLKELHQPFEWASDPGARDAVAALVTKIGEG